MSSKSALKKNQVWQRTNIERRRDEIARELRSQADGHSRRPSVAQVAAICRRQLHAEGVRHEDKLSAFLLALETIRLQRDEGESEIGELTRLFNFADCILKSEGIKPSTSRLAFLHGELHFLRSDLAADRGEAWDATWDRLIGYYKANRDCDLPLPTDAWLGNQIPSRGFSDQDPRREAHRLRLSGQTKEAEVYVRRQLAQASEDTELNLHLRWEMACLSAKKASDVSELGRICRRGLPHHRAPWLLDFALWSKACKSKAWLASMPRLHSLRRQYPETSPDEPFLRAIAALERAYETTVSLPSRLERVGDVLRTAEKIGDWERQCLVWSAAARWLIRVKQDKLAFAVLSRYRVFCFALSQGRDEDLLGLLSDLEFRQPEEISWRDFSSLPRPTAIPSTKLARGSELSKLGIELAWRRSTGADSISAAEAITRCAARLRGPLMKLVQWVSYCGHGIPDETARALSGLQELAEPLDGQIMRELVEKELGRPLNRLFSEWDDCALGAGSVGQVHRARMHDGREVAVKVQYPRIDEAMANDVFCVSLWKPLLRRWLPHWDFSALIRELRVKMNEECDFRREAEHQVKFRTLFASDPVIWVPEVHLALTSKRVLTTELVIGRRLRELAQDRDQNRRNWAAETIARWQWRSIFHHRYFNSDPHPGNFLFTGDRIATLDFGSVKAWPAQACSSLRDIMESFLNRDVARFRRGMESANMIVNGFRAEEMFEALESTLLGKLLFDQPGELTHAAALNYFRLCTTGNSQFFESVRISEEHLLVFRAHWGLFATLGYLTPRVNWRQTYLSAVG